MSGHTDVQIIRQGGKPVFAVVPYDRWLELSGDNKETYIPHEVVGYQLHEGLSALAAWRKYLGITQKELAAKVGMSQPAIAQIEKIDSKPQKKTLKKIAAALQIEVDQLTD